MKGKKKKGIQISTFILLGIVFGIIFKNLAIGVSIGLLLGLAASSYTTKKEKDTTEDRE